MKNFKQYLYEHLDDSTKTNMTNNITNEAEESIKTEKDFRDYAKNKFEIVFGKDKVDEEKMKKIVDGIIDKYGKDGDWGQAVGVLNKSFGK